MFRLPVILAVVALLTGCSDLSLPPKIILADGQTYYACRGYVRSFQKTFGGETYTVEFTNRDGHKVQLRGVSKLTISDMPAYVWSEMPANLPDPKTAKEGSTVSDWNTPKKRAILLDGVWQPISMRNPVCIGAGTQSVTLEEWEEMTPQQQAAFKGVIDLPDTPK